MALRYQVSGLKRRHRDSSPAAPQPGPPTTLSAPADVRGRERLAGAYIDTTALGRVLLGEPDAAAIVEALRGFDRHVSSRLLALELRRLALRHDAADDAELILAAVALVAIEEPLLDRADRIEPESVAALDAIHLACAVALAAAGAIEVMVTFDRQLAEGCAAHGLAVLEPGRSPGTRG